MKPIVAIVGRPNVGKSTLFNRVTRTKDALVDDFPGVTRDRHYGDACWNDIDFTLVDTGGFTEGDDFADEIRYQVNQAISDADLIILLMDGKEGISPFDREMVDILRAVNKPVFYAVNKIDGAEQEVFLSDFYQLGLEIIYPLSAEHRYGITDLLDEVAAAYWGRSVCWSATSPVRPVMRSIRYGKWMENLIFSSIRPAFGVKERFTKSLKNFPSLKP
jgi:GTP-binding protein